MRLTKHPLARALAEARSMLKEATREAGYFAALSDADGVLLWADGDARALEGAVMPRFMPGHLCSEEGVGTNAIGTALVLNHPVQIFSAEHYNEMLHGWVCAAAPIHDPSTGQIIGALDLSGAFRTCHVHSLALVSAVAGAMESRLAADRARREQRMRLRYLRGAAAHDRGRSALVSSSGEVLCCSPSEWLARRVHLDPTDPRSARADGAVLRCERFETGFIVRPAEGARHPRQRSRLTMSVLGRRRARVVIDGRRIELRPLHSDIMALLALCPEGLTASELALQLYGDGERQATVRAEISRLRTILGEVLPSEPYRLDAGLWVDAITVQRLAAERRGRAARQRYSGPLLPGSCAPGVVAARALLERAIGV